MRFRSRFKLLLFVVSALFYLNTPILLQAAQESSILSSQAVVFPLQPVSITVKAPNYNGPATLLVFDSAKRPVGAWELQVVSGRGALQVTPYGALGSHWAALFVNGKQIANGTLYQLDAATTVQTNNEPFDQLYTKARGFLSQSKLGYSLNGTYVQGYRSPDSPLLWLRDHYYQGHGYRYFESDVTTLIDAFRQAQQSNGSLPDFLAHPNRGISAYRTPVEADVEYLFVLAIYEAWQMTGNDEWLRIQAPAARQAIAYTLNDRLRWDPWLGLVKRPFTIDTLDFEYGPTTTSPYDGKPSPRHWIDDRTKWGIFHGDNTGLAQALRALARIEQQLGQWESAWYYRDLAEKIIARLNTLSWNGSFYTHHVKLVPFDVPGVDEATQLSLSNALALNRGVLTTTQGRAMLAEYVRRKELPNNIAFAEWWSIDPPFPAGSFGLNGRLGERPGEYVNGGIMPLVGGELSRGAFRYGYEEYGFDILRRYYDLIKRTNASYLWYHPTGGISASPHTLATDGWGAGAMLAALMEGAAGIEDNDIRYNDVTLSPRWPAAGLTVTHTYVVARYAAANGYVAYRWQYDPNTTPQTLQLEATGSGGKLRIRLLIPGSARNVQAVQLNDRPIKPQIEQVGDSRYLVLQVDNPVVKVQVQFD